MSRPAWAWIGSRAPLSATTGGVRPALEPQAVDRRSRSSDGLIHKTHIAVDLGKPADLACRAGRRAGPYRPRRPHRKSGRPPVNPPRSADRGPGVRIRLRATAWFSAGQGAAATADRGRVFPGPVDGRYGPDTQHAVRDFQTATGLTVDGIAGPITQATITRSRNTLYPGAGDTGPSSQRVRALQRGLIRAGVNPGRSTAATAPTPKTPSAATKPNTASRPTASPQP